MREKRKGLKKEELSHLAEFSEDDAELLVVAVPAEAVLAALLLHLPAGHLTGPHSHLGRRRGQPGKKSQVAECGSSTAISGIECYRCVIVGMGLNSSIKGFLSCADFTPR